MSRNARRLPVEAAVDRVLWPATSAGTVDPTATASDAEPWQPKNLPVREPLVPTSFAERLAATEREAYARGVAEGREDAMADALARVDGLLRRLATTIDEIANLAPQVLRKSEGELVRMALAIAEHVVRRVVEVDRALLVAMAQAAIERLGGTEVATIALNPADFAVVSRVRATEARNTVDVVADPQVPRGGCLVRSASGVIDLAIDSQFREITRAIVGDAAPPPATAGDALDPHDVPTED